MSDDFEVGEENEMGVFHPTLVQRWSTNLWPFQHDYVMCEVAHAHRKASARWEFVVKSIYFYINL